MTSENTFIQTHVRSKEDVATVSGLSFKRVEELMKNKGVRSNSADEYQLVQKLYEISRAYQELFGTKVSGTTFEQKLLNSSLTEIDRIHNELRQELMKS